MMLVSGANLPLTIHQNNFIIHCQSETEISEEDLDFPEELFTREYDKGIYRFNLKGWEEFPHFAINAGHTPDFAVLAKKAGLDESHARDLYKEVMKTFGRIGGNSYRKPSGIM
jgi:hypothetical protein